MSNTAWRVPEASMYPAESEQELPQLPRPTICAQCEDKTNPVIEQVDGFSFNYEIVKGVTMEIFLHHNCAFRWYRAFSAHSRMQEDLKSNKAHA